MPESATIIIDIWEANRRIAELEAEAKAAPPGVCGQGPGCSERGLMMDPPHPGGIVCAGGVRHG
jgi:hypothetical protein